MNKGLAQSWGRKLWASDKFNHGLKVAIALATVVAGCSYSGHIDWVNGLILGVIASAMAEYDDRPWSRLLALLVTLCCFAFSALAVRLLFDKPGLFAAGLALSTFLFVMLGAIGERFAAVASASLLLAIYTMLSIDQGFVGGGAWWLESVLLLSGAAGYGLWSLLWSLFFSTRPARQALARVYLALAQLLERKEALLEADERLPRQPLRLALAEANRTLVQQMETTRQLLRDRLRGGVPGPRYQRYLTWYFLAQDVHERASSAHYPYETWAATFARSDLLFRAQRLIGQQAERCRHIAAAIGQGCLPSEGQDNLCALDQLNAAVAHVEQEASCGATPALLESVADLCHNLAMIDRQLTHAANPEAQLTADADLADNNPNSLREAIARWRSQLNLQSSRFRHAVRLALALAAGYGLMHALNLEHGYWVLLTTVFVCQPSYSGTWRRLSQRISGTVLGLLASSTLLEFVPAVEAQLVLAVMAGVGFFIWRSERYLLGTASMTVMVLICFNQLGDGFSMVWPRLLDTLIGGALAALAVAFILPDWQRRKLPNVMARTLRALASYLQEVMAQYHSGKQDNLTYRIARRQAHHATAELSTMLAAMLGEPEGHRREADAAFRFLGLSHTLLGYVSALGAHRQRIENWQQRPLLTQGIEVIDSQLQSLANQLVNDSNQQLATEKQQNPQLATALEQAPALAATEERRLLRQLALILNQLPELTQVINQLRTPTPASEEQGE